MDKHKEEKTELIKHPEYGIDLYCKIESYCMNWDCFAQIQQYKFLL